MVNCNFPSIRRKAIHGTPYVLCLLLLAACHSEKAEQDTAQFSVSGDTVTVQAHSDLAGKIKMETLVTVPYRLEVTTAGIINAIPTQYAEIAPPFSGRIMKAYLKLGMQCVPGTPLFEISSPDFIAAQKIFFQEKSQLQQAEKVWRRQQDLIKNGVGTQKDMEEAQTAYEVEKKEYENAVIGIKMFKANPDHLVLGQPLIVRSPITGQVIDNKVVVGQFLNDNAATVATVADLSKVWVTGKVKEKDIRFLHPNDDCEMDIMALPDKKIRGKIYHINEMVDEDTRSVDVYIVVENKNGELKKGMYANIRFADAPKEVVEVSPKAIFLQNDSCFVFLQISDHRFVKRKIVTAGTDDATGNTVVQSGLRAGDRIIAANGYFLMQVK